MSTCAVKDCTNSYRKVKMKGKVVKYFTFPKDDKIATKWREICRNGVNVTYGRICSDHFDASCYDKPAQQIALQYSPLRGRKLRMDAIPTMNLFAEPVEEIRTSTCAKNTSSKTALSNTVINAKISTSIPKSISENVETKPSTDCIDKAEPFPKSISENVDETEPSTSTTKSKSTTLEYIDNAMLEPSATSADYLTIINNLQLELAETKKALMESEKKKKKREEEKLKENMYRVLSQVFTPGQIKILLYPEKKRVVWSSEDIANAISLRCISPKAYRYLRNVVKMPLPGFSTLQRCTASTEINQKSLARSNI